MRMALIEQKLRLALQPTHLEVIDDSEDHIGHEGSRGGAGHYTVIIGSPQFTGNTVIQQHRLVYQALDGLIGPEIHALRIQVVS